MTTSTIPTMPDTHCPDWCPRAHRSEWLLQVEVCQALEAEGVRRSPETRFEPLHTLSLYAAELNGTDRVGLDLQAGRDGEVLLYLDAQGPLTASQARALGQALLEAAERLDRG